MFLFSITRYDQEMFRGKDDTHGFNIETTGTFSGMNLKSMTDGKNKQPIAKPNSNDNDINIFNSPKKVYSLPILLNSPSSSDAVPRPAIEQFHQFQLSLCQSVWKEAFTNPNHHYTRSHQFDDNNVQCQRYFTRSKVALNFTF